MSADTSTKEEKKVGLDLSKASFCNIYIMGKRYSVPDTIPIMKALEFCGYRLIRGVGCRGGVCGACATVYRIQGDPTLKVALACQKVVEPEMYLAQIPFFPAGRAAYDDVEKLEPTAATIRNLYPEIARCMGCNTCTKSCPQDIKVMEYISAALRGDIETVAKLSFECVMCGLCTTRCPANIVQPNIAILCRRLFGSRIAKKSPELARRTKEIKDGEHDKPMQAVMDIAEEGVDKLRPLYEEAQKDKEADSTPIFGED
ncbi:MAG: 4Fe-4S dicluster domain-containing protein [Planctomycetota bacterium]|jgi:heterodisulfide reductase subunit C